MGSCEQFCETRLLNSQRAELRIKETAGVLQMADPVNIPSGFGGLLRFNEEYDSYFNLKPVHVIVFISLIVIFRFALSIFLK